MKRRKGWIVGMLLVFCTLAVSAAEVGLVTALNGKVQLLEGKSVALELRPFVKVRDGDQLTLKADARLQIVFFAGGRQETWRGSGTLAVGSQSSQALKGGLQVESRSLPAILVKQLSKTPSPDGNVKAGMVRLRSMPSLEPLESVEQEYAALRQQTESRDRSPELYLLVSYFELRAFEKLEALIGQMREKSPQDTEVAALATLYSRAISQVKAAGQATE